MSESAPHGPAPDSPSDVRALPARPNLEFERKQAKKLLALLKKGDPEALARFHAKLKHSVDTKPDVFKLADAQFTIAREYGFTSWPRLVEYFEALDRHQRSGARGGDRVDHHEQVAASLLAQHRNRRPSAMFFATFVPRFYGRGLEEVLAAEVTMDDARLVHARMHRYPSWDALLEDARQEGQPPENEWTRSGTPDYRAGRAIRSGDIEALGRLIDENPRLLEKVERVGHVVPMSILHSAMWQELEVRTPEARTVSDYIASRGGGLNETLSAMLISPWRRREAEAVAFLLERGANPDWLPPNGIPILEHAICRYWNGAAVDLIARRAKPRKAFWIAAGLGDVDAVKRYIGPDGVPTAAARQKRPDFTALSVFPIPSLVTADDTAIVWEGFWLAAMNQRFAVLDVLLDRGFPIDYDAWGQSMLNLAVMNTWLPLVEYLVRRGANVDLRGWHPNSTAREMAERNFADRPNPDTTRLMELCGGRDPETVTREAAAERAKVVRPAPKFNEILNHARQDALHQGKTTAGLENLFVGLLRGEDRLPVLYLGHSGVDLARLKALLGNRLDPSEEGLDDMPLDDWATEACMQARAETERRRQTIITSLHLLFVLLKPDDGPIADMIRTSGGDVRKVQASLEGAI